MVLYEQFQWVFMNMATKMVILDMEIQIIQKCVLCVSKASNMWLFDVRRNRTHFQFDI